MARLIDPAYKGLLPLSLTAAIAGLILGPIPSLACYLLIGKVFYPLFIAAPLLIYLFNSLLRGCRDIRAIIVTAVFSLAAAYLTLLYCESARYLLAVGESLYKIPSHTVMSLNRFDLVTKTASACVYPLLFTALDVVIASQLYRNPAVLKK